MRKDEIQYSSMQYEIHVLVRVGLGGTLYCQTNGSPRSLTQNIFVYVKYRCEIVSFEAVLGITNKFKSNTLLLKM